MGKVLFGLSVSLDGFIADKDGDVSLVFAWFGSAMEELPTRSRVMRSTESGAVIMGHRSFDQIDSENGWVFPDGTAPNWPVIVLQSQTSHQSRRARRNFTLSPMALKAPSRRHRRSQARKMSPFTAPARCNKP